MLLFVPQNIVIFVDTFSRPPKYSYLCHWLPIFDFYLGFRFGIRSGMEIENEDQMAGMEDGMVGFSVDGMEMEMEMHLIRETNHHQ